MAYNQISATGSIISADNPTNFSAKEIREHIYDALNQNGYIFTWKQKKSQPYQGTLDDGDKCIDLFIYAWNMTPAYRTNPSEKRIQIQAAVNNIGIDRIITSTEKTVILGLYNSPTGSPLFAAWDTSVNRGHGQKSCYVQIEDVAQALTDGIYTTKDKNNAPIYTFLPEYLGDYVSQLKEHNSIGSVKKSESLKKQLRDKCKTNKKKRVIKSIDELHEKISNLSTTEQEAIQKVRIGQGYFRDLLIEKYDCKCALCDITTRVLLYASHIKAWSDCSSASEKLDENNGLLLCAHHDALFDKHLISFDANGKPVISSTLSPEEQASLKTSEIPDLELTVDMQPYMAEHLKKLK